MQIHFLSTELASSMRWHALLTDISDVLGWAQSPKPTQARPSCGLQSGLGLHGVKAQSPGFKSAMRPCSLIHKVNVLTTFKLINFTMHTFPIVAAAVLKHPASHNRWVPVQVHIHQTRPRHSLDTDKILAVHHILCNPVHYVQYQYTQHLAQNW